MNEGKIAELKKKVREGKIKSWELEQLVFKEIFNEKEADLGKAGNMAERIRAELLEEETGVSLKHVKANPVETARLLNGVITTGIELKIGSTAIPLGIAGPIKVNGEFAKGEFLVPLATNEAVLIAGIQRGFKALNKAGGVKTVVRGDGMTRAPVLEAPDIVEAKKLVEEIREGKLTRELIEKIKSIDPFCNLYEIEPFQLNNKVWLRLVFKTGDAMGMNSVTRHSATIVKEVLKKFPEFKLIALSGNLCADKKSAHINVLHGRGKSIETEVFISEKILKETFKEGVTSEKIAKINQVKDYLGSALSGTIAGFNANAANTIAAVFAATGQDLAQVVESSSCFVHAEAVKGGLRFGVSLPCLEVATIGGGTFFGTAKECLELMKCAGAGKNAFDNEKVKRLAEIIAAAVTGQELNLLAAFAAEYELASSHVKLAQGLEE